MTCSNCGYTNNPHGAAFCMQCGTNQPKAAANPVVIPSPSTQAVQSTSNEKNKDVLILVGIGLMLMVSIVEFIIQTVKPDWYTTPFKYVFFGLNLISGAAPLLFSFAVREHTLRIIAVIAAVMFFLRVVYGNVSWMTDMF